MKDIYEEKMINIGIERGEHSSWCIYGTFSYLRVSINTLLYNLKIFNLVLVDVGILSNHIKSMYFFFCLCIYEIFQYLRININTFLYNLKIFNLVPVDVSILSNHVKSTYFLFVSLNLFIRNYFRNHNKKCIQIIQYFFWNEIWIWIQWHVLDKQIGEAFHDV